jgi:hypothetical protein
LLRSTKGWLEGDGRTEKQRKGQRREERRVEGREHGKSERDKGET